MHPVPDDAGPVPADCDPSERHQPGGDRSDPGGSGPARPDVAAGEAAGLSGFTERVEAFVVRTALDADGEPLRSRIEHVRSRAEVSSAGWQPDEMVLFMEDCLRLPRSARPAVAPAQRSPEVTACPAVNLDVGTVIGGGVRDVELAVATWGRSPFTYAAALSTRPYGRGTTEDCVWTTLATLRDTAVAGERLDLRFVAASLPTGLQRLRLHVTASSTGTDPPPGFALVGRVDQA